MSALTCSLAPAVMATFVLGAAANGDGQPLTWREMLPGCALIAAIFVLPSLGGAVYYYVKGRRDRSRAEGLLSWALTQAAKEGEPENTGVLLQEAISACPAIDIPDLERLAHEMHVPLSPSIQSAFRQVELRYLKELLASPEHLSKRVRGAAIHISHRPPPIHIAHTQPRVKAVLCAYAQDTTPAINIEIGEKPRQGKRTLEILLTLRTASVGMGGASARCSAFIPGVYELPTNEGIVSVLATDMSINSFIARRFHKDVRGVMHAVVNFVKGRRIADELDEVVVHERKYVPVYWFENVTSILAGFVGATSLRTTWWGLSLLAEYEVAVDMAPLPTRGSVSWDFKEDEVSIVYVPA